LTDAILEKFWAKDGRGFYLTSHDHETLVTRPLAGADQSIPSGSSEAVFALLRVSAYQQVPAYRDLAQHVFTLSGRAMEDNPFGYANLLGALDLYHEGTTDVVLIGPAAQPGTRALRRAVHAVYAPNRTLITVDPTHSDGPAVPEAARGKTMLDNRPTVFVCKHMTCSAPLTDPAALRTLLSEP
jgi:uncharacterized protein YyaL (SSP411 family)